MEEKTLNGQESLEAIARTIEAQRRRIGFVRSSLFFGAGWIAAVTLTAQFILEKLTDVGWLWVVLWLPAVMVGCTLLLVYRNKHGTVTLSDRHPALRNGCGAAIP